MARGSVTLLAAFAALVTLGGLGADRYHPEHAHMLRASAVRTQETDQQYWYNEARAGIELRAGLSPDGRRARNLVMFLGDGMSVPTLSAARALQGQRAGAPGEEDILAFERFPIAGLSKTYCVNAQIADSACTATAYLCGAKANQGTLGLSAAVPRHDCTAQARDQHAHLASIAAWALQDGRDAGIVTTTRVTHASPGGAYARSANRGWESDANLRDAGVDPALCQDIADQLINSEPGTNFKVILGGGRREFIPVASGGRRQDGRDLTAEWAGNKRARNQTHAYVTTREELLALGANPPEHVLGLFANSHLPYHEEANATRDPTLAELTEFAVRLLSRNERGFFLFVEGGRIDHAHHDNLPRLALDETIQLSEAVARARELLHEEDSLIVVTSDHAHVMAYNGYSPRGNDILGASRDLDDHGVPYMTLSYTNGPGFRAHYNGSRVNVLNETNYQGLRWTSHVDVPLESETHGGDDVGVFASGPQQHLFSGVMEQSAIPHRMAYAACIGPGLHVCSAANNLLPTLAALVLAFGLMLR